MNAQFIYYALEIIRVITSGLSKENIKEWKYRDILYYDEYFR